MKNRTDNELIENLEFMDNYEIAYRFKELKKENANLKRTITKLKKGDWNLSKNGKINLK